MPTTLEIAEEQAYPLTPLQQGMLYHALSLPGTGVDVLQADCRMDEEVDAGALREAWRRTTARHAVLRTSFRWEGDEEPVQVVHRRVETPWRVDDWTALSPAEQERRLEGWLEDDRRHGIDLGSAPPMRLALLRTGPASHRLIWTVHHAVVDARSVLLVLEEALQAYDAIRGGEAPEAPHRRPFRHYVSWLRARDPAAHAAYWRGLLGDFADPTPVCDPPPAAPGAATRFARRSLRLPREATAALTEAARREGVAASTMVQAAWALVLGRQGGVDEAVFGAARQGRREGLEGAMEMVGLFITTLPLRIPLPAEMPVGDWLRAVRAQWTAQRAHETAPLAQVQQWSGVAPGTPLFESVLNFDFLSVGSALKVRTGWEDRHARLLTRTNFPVTVTAFAEDELELRIDYDAGRVDDGAAERTLERLARALELLSGDGDRPLGTLSLLSGAEWAAEVETWNATAADLPRAPVHERFAEQAARTPAAVAVVAEEERLTYGALEARANRIARYLRKRGVGPEVRVALLLDRGTSAVAALLGVLKAGGAYLPLDPAFPPSRLEWMLADSGARVIVTTEPLAAALPAHGAEVVRLDRDGDAIAAEPAEAPAVRCAAASLAYVIYTSGSTGRSKGVAVEHRQLAAYTAGVAARLDLPAGAHYLMVSTPAADLGNTVLFPSLVSGGTLHLVSRERAADPAGMAEYLRRSPADCLKIVPSHLAALLTAPDSASVLPRRRLVLGGEASRRAWVDELRALAPDLAIHNHYGPTETTVGVLTQRADRALPTRSGTLPLGLPIPGARVYLLDAGLRPVLPGAPGELFIGGEGVSRGYLGRPGATAERFLPDPFGPAGARLYRTGDRARRLADGALEFLGRTDHQVKVRGYRVEPGEVESVLARHPGVREAVVLALGDETGGALLAAYVVPAADAPSAGALRDHLRTHLPDYMVPSAFVFLDALPLTPNGKVDRRALPAPAAADPAGDDARPRTPVEEIVEAIFREVLERERVGVDDSFFELGGHSLRAARVAFRVRDALGIELPLPVFLELQSVARVARWLETAGDPVAEAPPPIRRVPRDRPIPLSPLQEHAWLHAQFDPGSAEANTPFAVRLAGAVDPRALERAFDEVTRRHESLRTGFAAPGGVPVQVVAPHAPFRLPRVDLTALSPAAAETEARRLAREEARRPFDLRGPLLRVGLVQLAGDDWMLLVTLHHIICDGWSIEILVRELSALYAAYARGDELRLPEPPVQYADYAAWERTPAREAAAERQLVWWRERLRGARPLDLAGAGADANRLSPRAMHVWVLEGQALEDARRLGRREGCTLLMVVLAAWKTLLLRYTGQSDLSVATPLGGRTHPELSELIGFFARMAVLRTDLSGNPTFREALHRVRETVLSAYAHQDAAFFERVGPGAAEEIARHAPLFGMILNYRDAARERLELGGVAMRREPMQARAARGEALTLVDEGSTLRATFLYRVELFPAETVAAAMEHLTAIIALAVEDPGRRILDLPLG